MPQQMRVCNGREYNTFLKNRGKFFCIIKKILPKWYSYSKKQRGANDQYSDDLIVAMYTIAYITSSALRQTAGIFEDYIENFKLNLIVPNYSTMSRRFKKLNIKINDYRKNKKSIKDIDVIIDSSGINIYNTGKSFTKTVGDKRKHHHYEQVRKMHIGLDMKNKDVLSFGYSNGSYADHLIVRKLINIIGKKRVKSLRADRAYDRTECYKICHNKIEAIIPPIKCANIRKEEYFDSRNQIIKDMRLRKNYIDGIKKWKSQVGYGKRSYVETFFSRFKKIFGFSFNNKHETNRKNELIIKCNILNYFNSIGQARFQLIA